MTISTQERHGTEASQTIETAEQPQKIIGRFIETSNGAVKETPAEEQPILAVFCHDPPESYIGGHVARVAPLLARGGRTVHLFSRYPFTFAEPGVVVHAVGSSDDGDVVAQAK